MATNPNVTKLNGSGSKRETFSDAHWKVLFAIFDAVIPAIVAEDGATSPEAKNRLVIPADEFDSLYEDLRRQVDTPPDRDLFRNYMGTVASDDPIFVKVVKDTVEKMPPRASDQLRLLLGVLRTRIGALLSTGSFSGFDEQPAHRRDEILRSWFTSWVFIWPKLGRTFTLLAKACWSQYNPLLEQACRYKSTHENPQVKPGPAFDFHFLQFSAAPEPATLETDIVIIGSGCGGGVSAKVLAEAGLKVLVVDRGYYFSPSECPATGNDLHCMMQGGGGLASADGSTMVGTGQVWGGGGSVNWSMSLQTPDVVRREWADTGLDLFTKPEYQQSLDRVCSFMGVSDAHLKHNRSNTILLEGSKKLAWKTRLCPQNTGGSVHSCGGGCVAGCRDGKKQGPAVSWLPAAARSGAQFMEGCDVTRIRFDEINGVKKAVAVEAIWTSRDTSGSACSEGPRTQRAIHINAKKVILAGGALNSPLLLQKSGLQNPNIGQNLRLHPAGCLAATFPEEIRGWEGEIGTALVTEFEDLDGKGHGTKVMGIAMIPFLSVIQIPWRNGLQFKTDALKYPHMACFTSVSRDRDSGSVISEPSDGRPFIHYTPSEFDRKNVLIGLVAASKISYVQGATEIAPVVPGLPAFKSQLPLTDRKPTDPEFAGWLARLEAINMSPNSSVFTSAHQMGTCRMSISEQTGVVDQDGKVWGVEDLYIADSSVFPSASGSNPMVTVMAISDHIARGIAARW